MYQSKKQISRAGTALLRKELNVFCIKNTSWYCCALKRHISLEKLPPAIVSRKASRGNRLRCFWVALDILRQENQFKIYDQDGNGNEISIEGNALNGEKVSIHLRREVDCHKDARWFFVSCFYKEK